MELQTRWNNCDIYLHNGDITDLEADAVVNAANAQLRAGSGVCGAIHRRGGRAIAEECSMIIAQKGEVPVGGAVLTTGGHLPARHVIHAVGPIYDDYQPQEAAKLLASAYRNSLAVARADRLSSIAFPCLSTGVYGYPKDEACQVALRSVRADLWQYDQLAKVIFCTFGDGDYRLYQEALPKLEQKAG
jgi:O-acetyl-ADP-ribose deacetylase (regulator of RNase III)